MLRRPHVYVEGNHQVELFWTSVGIVASNTGMAKPPSETEVKVSGRFTQLLVPMPSPAALLAVNVRALRHLSLVTGVVTQGQWVSVRETVRLHP